MKASTKLFVYGTGNMAWSLIHAFQSKNRPIQGVFGHTQSKAEQLAKEFGLKTIHHLETETEPGDVLILALKDDALPLVNESLRLPGRIVLHTAGSVDLNVIDAISESSGVFYPLQRVMKGVPTDFSKVPFCLESKSENVMDLMKELAGELSGNVLQMSGESRKQAHLAAIFVSNFPNFMLVLAADLLKENNLPSNLLDELALNTFQNPAPSGAFQKQTGPARRADLKIINTHLKMLADHPALESIYRTLSFEIMKRYNENL